MLWPPRSGGRASPAQVSDGPRTNTQDERVGDTDGARRPGVAPFSPRDIAELDDDQRADRAAHSRPCSRRHHRRGRRPPDHPRRQVLRRRPVVPDRSGGPDRRVRSTTPDRLRRRRQSGTGLHATRAPNRQGVHTPATHTTPARRSGSRTFRPVPHCGVTPCSRPGYRVPIIERLAACPMRQRASRGRSKCRRSASCATAWSSRGVMAIARARRPSRCSSPSWASSHGSSSTRYPAR